MTPTPTKIEPFRPSPDSSGEASEMLLGFSNAEEYAVPYVELRFMCPCASCVDEHTGKRVIKRESIQAGIRASSVQLIGRYAVQISWSDRHSTGMYHYDRLFEISRKMGRRLK